MKKLFSLIALVFVLLGGVFTVKTEEADAAVPKVEYRTHIQRQGWQSWKKDGATSGTSGKSLRLEGIQVKLPKGVSGGIEYRTHIQKLGWETSYKKNGAMSGTSGRSLRLEAIQIRLTGDAAKKYDVYYRVHAQQFGWLGWTKNNGQSGTAGYSYRLEAIQIKLVAKGSRAPGSTTNAFYKKPALKKRYNNGKYTIGKNMPAGEYKVFDNDNDDDGEISIEGKRGYLDDLDDFDFDRFCYIKVNNGERLELEDCYAVPVKYASSYKKGSNGRYQHDAIYKVGKDIPAGSYTAYPRDDDDGEYTIYNGAISTSCKIVTDVDDFERPRKVTLKAGQYIELDDSYLK